MLSIWKRKQKIGKWSTALALSILLLFSNPFFANYLWQLWEWPPAAMKDQKKVPLTVVLTGVTLPKQEPTDRVHYRRGADRMLHTLQLYREGKIERLLISGANSIEWDGTFKNDFSGIKKSFLLAGVPDSVLFVEEKARNTHENATYSKAFVKQHWPSIENNKIRLVTSAFHMRRAKACFEKEGLSIEPFPADFRSTTHLDLEPKNIFPEAESFFMVEKIIHEWVGFVVYKALGYA